MNITTDKKIVYGIPLLVVLVAMIIGGVLLRRGDDTFQAPVLTAEEEVFFSNRVTEIEENLKDPELSMDEKHTAYIDLGANYVLLGKFEDAKLAFEKAAELKPEDIVAYRELWVLAEKMGDKPALRKYGRKLAELDPDNEALYERRLEEIE